VTPVRALWADRRGVAAVEFALISPLLLLLYFGSVEITQGLMARQKVAHAASAVGDLVAQSSTVTAAKVTDIFGAGATYMYPYSSAGLKLRVSSLTADANGAVTVAWSQGDGLPAYAKGSAITAPSSVIAAGGSAILGEAQYTYTSLFGQVLPKPITFSETYYLAPRVSTQVTCADC
jgi:Flp pilus assembly protein TadG